MAVAGGYRDQHMEKSADARGKKLTGETIQFLRLLVVSIDTFLCPAADEMAAGSDHHHIGAGLSNLASASASGSSRSGRSC